MKTKIIVIEGIDGSGKTLQFNLLKNELEKIGSCLSLDFPNYESFFGKQIGKMLSGKHDVKSTDLDAKSLALWFACDRLNKFKNLDYKNYDFLLMNRYVLSNIVYQSLEKDISDWINKLEYEIFGLPKSDIYIVLDMDYDFAKNNIKTKGFREYVGEDFDLNEKNEEFLKKIRKSYIQMSKKFDNIEIISCIENNKLISPNEIFNSILKKLKLKNII